MRHIRERQNGSLSGDTGHPIVQHHTAPSQPALIANKTAPVAALLTRAVLDLEGV
jgi:hypothetical protein